MAPDHFGSLVCRCALTGFYWFLRPIFQQFPLVPSYPGCYTVARFECFGEVSLLKKRSHKLLASALLQSQNGFHAKRFELAFLFGSFQPDCNPLTYLKGSRRAYRFRGHNFSNSQPYINVHIQRLQQRSHWTIWQYYTLGKLTHYLADAFTYPHNENYPDSLLDHRRYEDQLRQYLADYLSHQEVRTQQLRQDLVTAIDQLHRQYTESRASLERDIRYILEATGLLMAGCVPQA